MDYEKLTDEEIAALAAAGDTDATDFLMDKYKRLVRRITSARFLIGGERDDLLQEGMIGLFKAIRDYKPDREASFKTFAALCVERQIARAIEASLREKHIPLNTSVALEEGESLPDTSPADPEYIILDREQTGELLARVRGTLSRLEIRVLDLALEGLTYQEIAARLSRTPKSIDNALQRIRRKTRAALQGGDRPETKQ